MKGGEGREWMEGAGRFGIGGLGDFWENIMRENGGLAYLENGRER